MKFEEIFTLLPCHSMDDFPIHHVGEDADGLMAAYSALWHPRLIHLTGRMPSWRRGNDDEADLSNRLIILPKVCQDDMPGAWLDGARGQGATVLEGSQLTSRAALLEELLEAVGGSENEISSELVADFLALGLAHLWTQVLTIQMRYSSIVDEDQFEELLVAAAKAAVAGENAAAEEKLVACYDNLAESKDHFYPVDTYLLDLTLVSETTMGPELAAGLASGRKMNLLVSSSDLRRMRDQHPDTFQALCSALDAGNVSLVGGDASDVDGRLAMLSADVVLRQMTAALDEYRSLLDGQRPVVFGRRRYGLSSLLPQILSKLGYIGALHFSLAGGRVPHSYQNKIQWQGIDGSSIDAYTRMPIDAAKTSSFIGLPQHLGESMDHDHVAATCFASWPGHASPWYEELKRITKFGTVLGRFVTFEEFFAESEMPGESTRFEPDDYRTPYLREDVDSKNEHPISNIATAAQENAIDYSSGTIATLAELLSGRVNADDDAEQGAGAAEDQTDRLERQADDVLRLVGSLPRDGHDAGPAYTVVNPLSFSRTVVVDTPELQFPPAVGGAVLAAFEQSGRRQVVVDVPPVGYAWIGSDSGGMWTAPDTKPLAEDNILRTEHFEVRVSPETGSVQSVHNFRQRGNLFSQRLAMRLPSPRRAAGQAWQRSSEKPRYTDMVADEVRITDDSAGTASITSSGKLIGPDGQAVANFQQSVSIQRTRSVIEFDIDLDPLVLPDGNPWESYYAALFAWPDDADVTRSVGLGRHATERRRLEAPHFVEIAGPRLATTILTGGLPYHVRADERQLDTLLIVPGESQRRFRFAVAIGETRPHQAALELLIPPIILAETAAPPSPSSSWFFHLSAKNVVALRWTALTEDSVNRGIRVRLQETAGRSCGVTLRSFQTVNSARKVDYLGDAIVALESDDDGIKIDLTAYEMCDVELLWQA